MDDRLWFRQLSAGRDFAERDPVARAMGNYVYLLGDRERRECLVVDPAWDIPGLLRVVDAEGFRLVGALITHWHPDHVGGPMMGHDVQGLASLLTHRPVPIHVHQEDLELVCAMTGLSRSDLSPVTSGQKVLAGDVEVECLHTPGHTRGSQCFRCGKALVSGDTLFLQGCGRTDLPGGDPEEMWRTLRERLLTLPRDLVLWPGHNYGVPDGAEPSTLEEVARVNPVLRVPDWSTFRRAFGG
jgi:glyoxylase-like metal-dependent hydrolase (beta-lactamase superfamily II)